MHADQTTEIRHRARSNASALMYGLCIVHACRLQSRVIDAALCNWELVGIRLLVWFLWLLLWLLVVGYLRCCCLRVLWLAVFHDAHADARGERMVLILEQVVKGQVSVVVGRVQLPELAVAHEGGPRLLGHHTVLIPEHTPRE